MDRQERRKQATIASHATSASWDFQSTINVTPTASPTHSMYSQPASPIRAQAEGISTVGVVEIEDHDARTDKDKRGGRKPFISHSRSSTKVPRDASIIEEPVAGPEPEILPARPSKPLLSAVSEIVGKSSSSSISNAVDPLLLPSSNTMVPVTHSSNGLTSSTTTEKSSNGSMSMWKKLTGKSKTKVTKEKTLSQGNSIVGALLERTSSRK